MIIEKTSADPKNSGNRSRAEAAGRAAEHSVSVWYETQGYTTLGRRVRTPRGEIDLVVTNDDTIIFVEVKARRNAVAGAESVTPRQQARITGAAEIVLAEHPSWARDSSRFDVVLVVAGTIIAIPDAFRLS